MQPELSPPAALLCAGLQKDNSKAFTLPQLVEIIRWFREEPVDSHDLVRDIFETSKFPNFTIPLLKFMFEDLDRVDIAFLMTRLLCGITDMSKIWLEPVLDASADIPHTVLVEFLSALGGRFKEMDLYQCPIIGKSETLMFSVIAYCMYWEEPDFEVGEADYRLVQMKMDLLDTISSWLLADRDHKFLRAACEAGMRVPRLALRSRLMVACAGHFSSDDLDPDALYASQVAVMCAADSLGMYPDVDPCSWVDSPPEQICASLRETCCVLSDRRIRLVPKTQVSTRIQNMIIIAGSSAEITVHESEAIRRVKTADQLLVYMVDMFGYVDPGSRRAVLESCKTWPHPEYRVVSAVDWALWKQLREHATPLYSPSHEYWCHLQQICQAGSRKRSRFTRSVTKHLELGEELLTKFHTGEAVGL